MAEAAPSWFPVPPPAAFPSARPRALSTKPDEPLVVVNAPVPVAVVIHGLGGSNATGNTTSSSGSAHNSSRKREILQLSGSLEVAAIHRVALVGRLKKNTS
jgi:hypothetical protein